MAVIVNFHKLGNVQEKESRTKTLRYKIMFISDSKTFAVKGISSCKYFMVIKSLMKDPLELNKKSPHLEFSANLPSNVGLKRTCPRKFNEGQTRSFIY